MTDMRNMLENGQWEVSKGGLRSRAQGKSHGPERADATPSEAQEENLSPDNREVPSVRPSSEGTTLRSAWRQSYAGLAAILIFTLLINVLKLALPLYIFQLLDRVVSSRSVETLIMLTLIVVVAVTAGAAAEFVRRWLLIRWGYWIERQFGRRLLLKGLRNGQDVRKRPSDFLRDLSALRQFVAGRAAIAWLDVIYVPAFVLVIFLISPLISLVVVVAMTIILVLGVLNETLSRGSRSKATRATRDRADWLSAAERDPEVMGSSSVAGNLAKHWEQSSSKRLDQNLSTRWISLATGDSMRLVETCQRIACYGLGIWLVLAGNLTIGGVIAAAILGRIASGTFRRAMSSWRDVASGYSAYGRVRNGLGDEEARLQVTSNRAERLSLHLDDIGHRFSEQSNSLFRHISMSLEPGQMLTIIGPSGSGKSTMARILAGRIPPRTGMVRLGDADITRFPPNELASRLGYLSQHTQLFRGTVRENIAGLNDKITDDEVIAAADLVGIHETITSLPEGYETEIGDRSNVFSAGQCKQIALAGVICTHPDLLILDDPESFLDEPARIALRQALSACKSKGMIVIATSQSMRLGRISDRAIVFNGNGRTTICGSREEVRELRRASKRTGPRIVSSNENTG